MHPGVQKSGEQGFLPTPLVAQWLASASAHRRCKSPCPASRCHAVSKLRLLLRAGGGFLFGIFSLYTKGKIAIIHNAILEFDVGFVENMNLKLDNVT